MSPIPFTLSANFCQFWTLLWTDSICLWICKHRSHDVVSDSVTTSHGNSPSQDGRNFLLFRLEAVLHRLQSVTVQTVLPLEVEQQEPRKKNTDVYFSFRGHEYPIISINLPQPLTFKIVPSPCCNHYGQRYNSVENWIWSSYDRKYTSLLQQRMNYNRCVVVFAHFSHFWEKVLTYFSMISIIRLFLYFQRETFTLAILLSDFLASLGTRIFIFLLVLFRVFVKLCVSDAHLRVRVMHGRSRQFR